MVISWPSVHIHMFASLYMVSCLWNTINVRNQQNGLGICLYYWANHLVDSSSYFIIWCNSSCIAYLHIWGLSISFSLHYTAYFRKFRYGSEKLISNYRKVRWGKGSSSSKQGKLFSCINRKWTMTKDMKDMRIPGSWLNRVHVC